jgi:hypothetical protein
MLSPFPTNFFIKKKTGALGPVSTVGSYVAIYFGSFGGQLSHDSTGNFYTAGGRSSPPFTGVYKIDSFGVGSDFAGGGTYATVDGVGLSARFYDPFGITTDNSNSNLYVTDKSHHVIRKITIPGASVTTLAGTPGSSGYIDATGSSARFNQPHGIATDSFGNMYVCERGNKRIRKVTVGGDVTTYAGNGTYAISDNANPLLASIQDPIQCTIAPNNDLYFIDNFTYLRKISYSTGAVTTVMNLPVSAVTGIVIDNSFNLYFSSLYDFKIYKVNLNTNVLTHVAGNGVSAIIDNPNPLQASFRDLSGLSIYPRFGNPQYMMVLNHAVSGNLVVRKIIMS